MRFRNFCFIVLCLFVGCSYYNFSGSLPGHIKTAAVPLFQNETPEVDIVESVTDAIEKAIIDNGSMRIVGEFQADAVVDGIIVDVIDEADSYSRDEKADQFRIRIIAHVKFFDRVKNSDIWEEKNLEGWARYDASGSSTGEESLTREEAKEEAIKMLAKEIIDKTVTGW
ncbi:LPS assembly lipoprotein LptE [Candidatus Latescibacterota bacterium]